MERQKLLYPIEIWKTIPGYEGRYEVSDLGRVKSLKIKIRAPNGFRTKPEKILNPSKLENRYLSVLLCNGNGIQKGYSNGIKNIAVHILVLLAFVGPRPHKHCACHRNGIRTDNKLPNLYWGTYKQNAADGRKHGTMYNEKFKTNARDRLLGSKRPEAAKKISKAIQAYWDSDRSQEHRRIVRNQGKHIENDTQTSD